MSEIVSNEEKSKVNSNVTQNDNSLYDHNDNLGGSDSASAAKVYF
jgi:hypothetical protein